MHVPHFRRFGAPLIHIGATIAMAAFAWAGSAPVFTPLHATGVYAVGEKISWSAQAFEPGDKATHSFKVVFERNMKEPMTGGLTVTKDGRVIVETTADAPGMVTATVLDPSGAKVVSLGAAVSPAALKPTADRPSDFDAFWAKKLAELRAVPLTSTVSPIDPPVSGIEEAAVTLNSLHSQVRGYLARPKTGAKHPALLMLQYAGVYAIDPKWAAGRAAQGWLVFNVSAHDLGLDQKTGIRPDYQAIGNTDRETSYFLEMYLRDSRALDFLTTQPDWDGKVLVVNGASMGGQQSLVTAALNPDKVTAVVVSEPAGADAHAEAAGRKAGYPNWAIADPRVANTASYFDTVNFASKIKAPTIVSVGFLDSTVTASGVWTMYNQIPAPKEMVNLLDADHMHVTPDKMAPWQRRQEEVMATLLHGDRFIPKGE